MTQQVSSDRKEWFRELNRLHYTVFAPRSDVIRLPDVMRRVCLSKSTIYKTIHAGTFPAPVHLGKRAVAWRQADIDNWIATRSATH